MTYTPPPSKPDQLIQALSPIQDMLTQRQKVEAVMQKYGRQSPYRKPVTGPSVQWEGDPNG